MTIQYATPGLTSLTTRQLGTLTPKPTWVSGTDPGANTEATLTVPAGEYWVVHGGFCKIVCSAQSANRNVKILWRTEDSGNFFAPYANLGCNAAANETISFIHSSTAEDTQFNSQGWSVASQTFPFVLPPASVGTTATTNLQSSDNLTALFCLREVVE